MERILEHLISVNRALQLAFEDQKYGIQRRHELEKVYEPLLDLYEKKFNKSTLKEPRIAEERQTFNEYESNTANEGEEEEEEEGSEREEEDIVDSSSDREHPLAVATQLYPSSYHSTNTYYGLNFIDNKPFIGKEPISITPDSIILLKNKSIYQLTPGLWDLLTSRDPNPDYINKGDENMYRSILKQTKSYLTKSGTRVHPQPNTNYLKYIQPWATVKNQRKLKNTTTPTSLPQQLSLAQEFENAGYSTRRKTGEHSGEGLGRLSKVLTNSHKEYVYWNNPQELLDRLYIVYGEIKAGNTNPNLRNELVNIIQEFKEEL